MTDLTGMQRESIKRIMLDPSTSVWTVKRMSSPKNENSDFYFSCLGELHSTSFAFYKFKHNSELFAKVFFILFKRLCLELIVCESPEHILRGKKR